MKLKKSNKQNRKTSYPVTSRKIITKSQATDTEIDGGDIDIYKPSSAAQKTNSEFIDDTDEQNPTNNEGQEGGGLYMEVEVNPTSPTMMRHTPNSKLLSDAGPAGEFISERDQIAVSGQFETAISHMYNTGGPAIFNTDGTDEIGPSYLDNVDPAVFETDLRFEPKMLVTDLCLNS